MLIDLACEQCGKGVTSCYTCDNKIVLRRGDGCNFPALKKDTDYFNVCVITRHNDILYYKIINTQQDCLIASDDCNYIDKITPDCVVIYDNFSKNYILNVAKELTLYTDNNLNYNNSTRVLSADTNKCCSDDTYHRTRLCDIPNNIKYTKSNFLRGIFKKWNCRTD